MREKAAFRRAAMTALILLAGAAMAQDETPAHRGVKLQFIPPPMEGTISLGVYDAKGKLVRVLKREAATDDFTVALNGLITFWDGNDDSGKPMPVGKYSAHGFVVGEFAIEGQAYQCNDWIIDEKSPRIRRVESFSPIDNQLVLRVRTVDDRPLIAFCDSKGGIESFIPANDSTAGESAPKEKPVLAVGGLAETEVVSAMERFNKISVQDFPAKIAGEKISLQSAGHTLTLELADGEQPINGCPSRTGGMWVIAQTGSSREVREYSAKAEFIRKLAIGPDEPQPRSIAAAQKGDTIFLLEENAELQRVRGLELIASVSADAPSPASTWKTLFEKKIVFSDTFVQVRDHLKMPDGKPFAPQEKVTIPLRANPLEQDKPGKAEVVLAVDEKGGCLKLSDGLPLTHFTETAHLKWAAMARDSDGRQLTVFQSDGAVVEEFRVTKIANMMAFDCGDFDFDPASTK